MQACGRIFGTGSLSSKSVLAGLGFRRIRSESFSCTSINYEVRNMMPRQGRMLKKLMTGSKKKMYESSSRWVEKPAIGTATFLKPKEIKSPRRIVVLNSVLMETITDVMASGDFSQELLGLGIEISKVKVTSDYTIVNVFWVCPKEVDSEKTEKLLKSLAGPIRNHLRNHHVLGNVPFVNFVKDRHQGNINVVEQLLARADFGPDFIPNDVTHHKKSEFIRSQSVPPFPEIGLTKEKNDLDSADATLSDVESLIDLPTCIADPSAVNTVMRTDILGLKHVDIMQNVVQCMHKAKAEHRKFPNEEHLLEPLQGGQSATTPPNRGPTLTMSIRQFLKKRNKQIQMSRKQEIVDIKNAEFMEQCKQGMNMGEVNEMENDFLEDDFFEEEEFPDFNPEHSSDPPF